MGKKTPSTVNENYNPTPQESSEDWIGYHLGYAPNYKGSSKMDYDEWLNWNYANETYQEPERPTYEAKEFPQLPVTPSVPSGAPTPTAPRVQAPQAQVINRYLEQVMSRVGGEGSGQTEVGKALRAKSSGGEK